MMKLVQKRTCIGTLLLGLALVLMIDTASAEGTYLRPSGDSNSRLEIKGAIVGDDVTTVLFWTWPDRGDPDFKKTCPVNFYTVAVNSDLSHGEPTLAAKGVCTGLSLAHAGLLESGASKLVSGDRLEEWLDGEQISNTTFTSMKELGTLRVEASEMGSQYFDFSPSGDVVMAILVSGYSASDWPGVSAVVASLKPDNEKRWLLKLNQTNEQFMMDRLWAADDGGALLSISVTDTSSMVPDPQTQLLVVSAEGVSSTIQLMNVAEQFDMNSIRPGSEEDMQKFFAHQKNNRSEAIKKLSARARDGGGFDVLIWRESPVESRTGQFLLRIGSNGSVESEFFLGSVIEDHGLDNWFDFSVAGGQLVLLSKVQATQKGVQSRRKTWGQTAISRIDLESQKADSRLVPLDRQYLEDAMNAGDEGQQYLEARPDSTPVLLTYLGGVPLALGQRYTKGGSQLHLQEMNGDLMAFTEAYDRQQTKIAKEQQTAQKKADRSARETQLAQDTQSITGMSQDEFDGLDDKEQMQILMQDGNMEAVMAAVMKQAQAAQSGMTPEQQAQMQQIMQGNGMQMPANTMPDTHTTESVPAEQPEEILTVDSLQRGHIQYRSSSKEAVSLKVINRQTGDELMSRDFPDGVIDEYVSLGRYKLPFEQLGVIISDVSGDVLEDLTPELK